MAPAPGPGVHPLSVTDAEALCAVGAAAPREEAESRPVLPRSGARDPDRDSKSEKECNRWVTSGEGGPTE